MILFAWNGKTLRSWNPLAEDTPKYWLPPSFEDANSYIKESCRADRQTVLPGVLNEIPLKLSPKGYFLRLNEGEWDVYDACMMTLKKARLEKKIRVEVIGTVIPKGTTDLLIELGDVWLYNPAETIDPCLPGFDQKAGIVVSKVERGNFERLIKVDEIFDTDISVVHDDSEEEVENNFEDLFSGFI